MYSRVRFEAAKGENSDDRLSRGHYGALRCSNRWASDRIGRGTKVAEDLHEFIHLVSRIRQRTENVE